MDGDMDAGDFVLFHNQGKVYYKQREYSKAIEYLTKALDIKSDPDALKFRALCKMALKDYLSAINDLEQTIELDPNNPTAYILASETHNLLKSYEKALELSNKAIALKPETPRYHEVRALSYYFLKQYTQAIEDFNISLSDKSSSRGYFYRGLSNDKLGNRSDAVKDLQLAHNIHPKCGADKILISWGVKPEYGTMSIQGKKQDISHIKSPQETEIESLPGHPYYQNISQDKIPYDFSTLGGYENLKERLKSESIVQIKSDLAKHYGRDVHHILLYGPPGCGKTTLAKAVSKESGIPLIHFTINSVLVLQSRNDPVKQTNENISRFFNDALQKQPSILLIDDIDEFSESLKHNSMKTLVLNHLCSEIDKLANTNVIVLATSDYPWNVDPKIKRHGRFSELFYVPVPKQDDRERILGLLSTRFHFSKLIDLKALAERFEGYSPADMIETCEDAALIPLKEATNLQNAREVNFSDFDQVLTGTKPPLRGWYELAYMWIQKNHEKDFYPELFDDATRLSMPQTEEKIDLRLSDVIGLEAVKELIKREIIYPITFPEESKRFGKVFGGGILLYGPPGCGKTHVAKAIAGELQLPFIQGSISNLRGGAGPRSNIENMKNIFEKARKSSPCILLIDEIDSVGGTREIAGKSPYMLELVNQLLQELNNIKDSGVVVIAATNSPWAVDPAIRRTGRFNTHIFVKAPDENARNGLFHYYCKKYLLNKADGLMLDDIVSKTDKYSASDIQAICEDVSGKLLNEFISKKQERKVNQEDFLNVIKNRQSSVVPWYKTAAKQIEASGEKESFMELASEISKFVGPDIEAKNLLLSFEDVGGMEKVKESLRRNVIYPLMSPEKARDMGADLGGSILLYGPPGCGKTYIAKALAGETKLPFFDAKISDLRQSHHGNTVQAMRHIFEKAKANSPCILFIDEIDAIGGQRNDKQMGWALELINQFLQEINGLKDTNVFLIGATNIPWNIDPAVRRSGRFNTHTYVPAPDAPAREQVLKIKIRGIPGNEELDLNRIVELTGGWSNSDIEALCSDVRSSILQNHVLGDIESKATSELFEEKCRSRQSSLPPWFKQAFMQLSKSGEGDVYKELQQDLKDNNGELLVEELKQIYADVREKIQSTAEVGFVNLLGANEMYGIVIPEIIRLRARLEGEGKFVITGMTNEDETYRMKLQSLEQSLSMVLDYIERTLGKERQGEILSDMRDKTICIDILSSSYRSGGPSGGMMAGVGLVSALLNIPVPPFITGTGAPSIVGLAQKVGRVDKKISAAIELGMRKAFIPQQNYNELDEKFRIESQEKIELIPYSKFDELTEKILGPIKKS